ncbi:hypothetical protein G7Y89_g14145 [Cudoniella acicularis]|uniref:Uncharacterized protein n=1 Tax=Cudoniella acicularis TaxID=354080 RepID=A0A8H4R772_9HELO|nr:hypothetical protein G7Y89_g14145 [Cudoniella acicularis]
MSSGLTSLLTLLSSKSPKNSTGELPLYTRPSTESKPASDPAQSQIPPTTEQKSIYLLLCYNEGRYVVRLLHLDLVKLQTKSYSDLFNLLFAQYKQMRGDFFASLSLRTLTSIKFAHFEAHKNELVDVRKHDDIPLPQHPEYRYNPVPPELIPPVGERYMVRSLAKLLPLSNSSQMHLFHTPSHAGEPSFCLSRFLKKFKEKLLYNGTVNPGWGLQFIED